MLFIHTSFSQACGIYRIKYVGKIESKTHKIKKIKLPSIMFLHNVVDRSENVAFIEVDIDVDEINKETASHLNSHLYDNSNKLLEFYKRSRDNLLIVFIINEDGNDIEISKKLNWSDVEIKIVEDEGFGNLFEINLKEIKLK
ncbi:hypothetical protein [Pontimicrobium sp. SW4]|uniref:Uncharacterized protein n=1 Tax=Pontimicrobium sp. SW4 TaxID=3153519 RepID=A0AAU7BQT8_9FLAO